MSAIRVGVVGIGGRGQNYLRWLSEVDRRSYLGADRHWSHQADVVLGNRAA